ncbi:hypothetical protein ACHAQJ_002331 [Trichoderma viride]
MTSRVTSQPNSRGDFEIGIVCAQSFEYDAVCALFDNFWDEEGDTFGRAEGDPNTYTTGCMGGFNIVEVLLCNTGKVSAASAASSLRSSYSKIKLLILTGVCAAVPKVKDEELLLGDVIISQTVIQYDLGDKNVRSLAAIIETEMGLQRLEDRTSFHLHQIQDRIVKKKDKRGRNITTYEYPGSTHDALYKSTYFHKHRGSPQCICSDCHRVGDPVCDESRSLPCGQVGCEDDYLVPRYRLYEKRDLEISGKVTDAQKPRIFTGRFGSGDTVLNSGIDRDRLAQEHSIIAFETEGAGVWDELPSILVKGVCSYGDGHKSNSWQHFAAATAASATKGLIERYTHTDISPSKPLIYESKMNKVTQDQVCLRDLRSTDPRDDKTRIQRTKGGLLRGSYSWILDTDMFKSWGDDPEARLLWIKGDPGKGKTMLLCGIIDELEKRPSTKLCYSFCQATDLGINNATAVLRGLLYMLLHQQESLLPYIKEKYDVSGKTLFEDANSWTALSKIFSKILADPSLEDSTIIIDALDECLVDLLPLLDWISQSLSSPVRVKWLISSRNRLDIQEALASANKSTLSLELNEESVSNAITVYIDHKVQLLSVTKKYDPAKRNSVKKYLSTNANGTFLWVALVCDLLEKSYLGDVPEEARYPQGLDDLYERMIQTVCSDVTDHGKRILSIVTVARRPLALQELISLMPVLGKVEDEPLLLDQLCEKITGVCGSFLTTRDHIIYFIHQSAKDFLMGKGLSKLFPTGIEETECYMFEASITSMTKTLKPDIYNLVEPGFPIESLPVLSNDPLYPVAYSCVYWIEHFEHSVPKVAVDDDNYITES